ncbi:MAG: Zn-dependent hydrolase [Lentisphaerae bacterium]|nr:Zn-dependent hydrolase [Lentisphaerota bacterium]
MTINAERIARDIEAIGGFSETPPDVGFSRPTFTPAWRMARDYVIAEARQAGCQVRIAPTGNVHARPASIAWETPVWLSGSHVDSVPTGGKFDGVAGVVAPLEVLRAHPEAPLELIIFAEEEGTTFNLGMLGSRAWTGTLTVAHLAGLSNRDGVSPLDAGRPYGVDAAAMVHERLDPRGYRGLIELHVEQGPAMWKAGQRVAVVTAIHGRRQYRVHLMGTPNHAGSTKMDDRADALAAAAAIMTGLEALAQRLSSRQDHTVITVGQLVVLPNAINVIPGEVTFTIDFRASTNAMLELGHDGIGQLIKAESARRGICAEWAATESLAAVPLDAGLCERLRAAARQVGVDPLPEAASGALHDAAILAPLLPTAMIFVASRDGISHNPAEFSRPEDVALGAEILAACVNGAA